MLPKLDRSSPHPSTCRTASVSLADSLTGSPQEQAFPGCVGREDAATEALPQAEAGRGGGHFKGAAPIRYTEIIDAALVRAVGDYLQKRGYSVVEFQRQAQTPTFDLRGAQGVAFGQGSSVSNNAFGPRPATQKDQR